MKIFEKLNKIKDDILKYIEKNKEEKEKLEINNSVYQDFTPIDTIDDEAEYLKALHWAIENDNIKNIALTGVYGSGKSSVIKTYLKKHKKCKAIGISLATFEGGTLEELAELITTNEDNDKNKEKDEKIQIKNFEDELEKGFLKQLFYRINADKIPMSRYRKLHHISVGKYIRTVIGIMIFIVASLYLIVPTELNEFFDNFINKRKTWGDWLITVGSVIVVIAGIISLVKFITSKFRIKELSVGEVTAVGEDSANDNVFSQNIDEIIYFFEKTKYNVVFIEDIDRFNSPLIFVKLREINTLLNQYEVIKKKIVFVYAIKDDLFLDEKERTKFFDFIIPIIPVINETNSGEIMRKYLMIGDYEQLDRKYPKHSISDEFISLISPYIRDMRVLLNIINEFWVYKRTLKDSQDVKLEDECIMAMMIYKNLYPEDFVLLESEEGDIRDAFDHKSKIVDMLKRKCENKIEDIKCLNEDVLVSIRELKTVILSAMVNFKGGVTRIYVDRSYKVVEELLDESYSFDNLRNKKLTVWYYTNSGDKSNEYNDVENENEEVATLFRRYDIKCEFKEMQEEEIALEIEKLDDRIIQLRAKTLQQLLEENTSVEVLPNNVKENELLVFLLRHGYINESYPNYINYFHSGSISNEELNYILAVRNHKRIYDFDFSIKNCANVINRLADFEFGQAEMLNFNIMDYMLNNKINYSSKIDILVKQIVNRSKTSKKFIKEYLRRGLNTEIFLKTICKSSKYIWKDLEQDIEVASTMKDYYLKQILTECSVEDIIKNNYKINNNSVGGIRAYIESDVDILLKLDSVSKDKMASVIDKLDVKFGKVKFDGVNDDIIKYIVDNRHYKINRTMIDTIITYYNVETLEKLYTSNYGCIKAINNKEILAYIDDNFENYIKIFILDEEDNTEESLEDIEEIIDKLINISSELCVEVIKKEKYARWSLLSNCFNGYNNDDKYIIWNCVLGNNRVDATWENYIIYRAEFGLTIDLSMFVNDNIDKLIQSSYEDLLTDDIVIELLIDDIDDDVFRKMIQFYKVESLTCECSVFSKEKIEILIREKYISFTVERYIEIKAISYELSYVYIQKNKEEFLRVCDECELIFDDISALIELNILSDEEIIQVLNCDIKGEMNRNVAMKLKDINMLLPKKHVDMAWDILKDEEKYELLKNQLDLYELDELAIKFGELGGVYSQFKERTRHTYTLEHTKYNEELCAKLKKVGYITSDKKRDGKIIGNVKKNTD